MLEDSHENEEDYWTPSWNDLPKILVIILTIGFIILYFNNLSFKEWVIKNIAYIHNNYDVMIFFYLVFVIPYLLFWISLITKFIKYLWISYNYLSVIIFMRKIRINISIFGFLSVFLAFSLNKNLLENWWIMIISFIALIIINYFLIKKNYYDQIVIEEAKKISIPKNERKIELTPTQSIIMIFAFLIPFLYFSIPQLQESVQGIGILLKQDMLSLILLIISLMFSFLWFFVAFISEAIRKFFESHKEKFIFYGQMLIVIMVLYVISKIIIFNLPTLLPDPYPSVLSMIISTSTGILSRYSKEIIGFIKSRKRS